MPMSIWNQAFANSGRVIRVKKKVHFLLKLKTHSTYNVLDICPSVELTKKKDKCSWCQRSGRQALLFFLLYSSSSYNLKLNIISEMLWVPHLDTHMNTFYYLKKKMKKVGARLQTFCHFATTPLLSTSG